MKKALQFLLLLCIPVFSYSQNFSSFQYGNYCGLHGVSANPAFLVGSPYRADINIVSASLLLNNDYTSADLSKLLSGDSDNLFKDIEDNSNAQDSNNFGVNVNILGPSFMFNIDEKSAFAFTTKARTYVNILDIDGRLYDYSSNGFEQTDDYNLKINNASITTHAWAEYGVSYARIIDLDNDAILKIGLTAKYLQGIGNSFIAFNDFEVDYNSITKTLNTRGTISYGSSQDFDSGDFKISNGAKGYGFDIGAVYQFSPDEIKGKRLNNFKRYKYRLAASITDIGKVTYPEGTQTKYNVTKNNINATALDGSEDTLKETLESLYPGQGSINDLSVKLPTALHINVDYNINNTFYVNLNTDLALGGDNDNANKIINSYSLIPRFERKWASAYSPISLDGFNNFSWGFGFRAGPLFVGSNTILSNLMQPSKKIDVHFGLKIPLFKRSKLKKEKDKPKAVLLDKKTIKKNKKARKEKEKRDKELLKKLKEKKKTQK